MSAPRPFSVGLTGGIGSGKSAAAALFAELGAEVIDTDAIARDLTAPGGAALGPIRREFGEEFVDAGGALDRARIRRLVFSDAAARLRLESILHPAIRAEAAARAAASRAAYCVLVIPLLVETGGYADLVDRVLVVDCDESLQLERTMARSRLSRDEVAAVMAAQAPRADRLARADDILHNEADLGTLRQQVEALHRRYTELARARASAAGSMTSA